MEQIKEIIKDIKENLIQIDYLLDNGATLGELCNWKNDFINNYNYLMKKLNDYEAQKDLKKLKRLESEIY
jgi:hypothetical protein